MNDKNIDAGSAGAIFGFVMGAIIQFTFFDDDLRSSILDILLNGLVCGLIMLIGSYIKR